MRTGFVAVVLAAVMIALAGCGGSGPKTYDVSGTVTFDGQNVPTGEIMFIPDDKSVGPVEGKITDGKYTAKVREGKNRVEIRASRAVPGKKGPMGNEDFLEPYIPKKYNEKSTLTADVGDGKTTHDFKLEK